MKARRTVVKLLYDGTDITQDVAHDLVSFTYNDNESGEADDITVKVKNDHGLWSGDWFPGKGDTLKATIIDEAGSLYCGTFKIDDLTYSGSPRTFDIKAVSIPLDETIRRKAQSKIWEDAKLSGIVNEIGAAAGLEVIYDVQSDPTYDRLAQREESDLKFLERIAKEEGFSVKVTDEKLVVFDPKTYEEKPPITSIELGKDDVLSFNFKSQAFDLYKSCTACYYDPEKEEEIEETFEAPDVQEGMEYRIVKRVGSLGEAKRKAKAKLRELNKHEVTGEITVRGITDLVAGVTLDIKGFGRYDGKYIIEKAGHNVANGYTVALTIRRVLEGY